MSKLADWKIQELRAAALCDLSEFIQKDFYAKVHTKGEREFKDRELVRQLSNLQFSNPQLTPRQLAAAGLLDEVVGYTDAENYLSQIARNPPADLREEFKPESFRQAWLSSLQDAVNRYASHLSDDKARALLTNHNAPKSANPKPRGAPNERRDRLTIAINAALVALSAKGQEKPTAGEVFDYLSQNDETEIICDSTDDKLVWLTSTGKTKDTARKSFENRMTNIWKKNPG